MAESRERRSGKAQGPQNQQDGQAAAGRRPSPAQGCATGHDDAGRPVNAVARTALSPEQLRIIVETMPVGVVVADATGMITLTNAAASAIFGGDVTATILGPSGPFCALYHGDGSPFATDELPLVRALERGEAVRDEAMVVRRTDGSELRVLAASEPLRDADGAITGAMAVLRDVSEQVRAEEAARTAAANYLAVFNAANDAIFVHDPRTGAILDVNQRMSELYGYTAAEARRLTVEDLSAGVPPYTQAGAARWIRKAIAGEPQLFDWLAKDKSGRLFWVEVNLKRVILGGELRLLAIVRDIGERKQTEEERERLLAELEATISSVPDALVVYDRQGNIRRMNPAAERLIGYGADMARCPLFERLAALRIETAEGTAIRAEEVLPVPALRGETRLGVVGVFHTPDGRTVYASASAAPIRTRDGHVLGAILSLTDITALRQLQESREDFTRAISHDLRQPLTIVQGHAEHLQRILEAEGADEVKQRGVAAILVGARRMGAMIQDLVDAARLQAGGLELHPLPIHLPTFIGSIVERMAPAEGSCRVHVEAPAGLPPVLADPDALERIVDNLLSNALKYSPPEAPVDVHFSRRGSQVVASVTDRGSGIPAEELPSLFDRYYRTRKQRERREGLGLGLYIVKGLVETQGGHIWVESEVGAGSTFSFGLPVARSAERSQAVAQEGH